MEAKIPNIIDVNKLGKRKPPGVNCLWILSKALVILMVET
jgi:hypothetical protein